jgi:hypothetical protein
MEPFNSALSLDTVILAVVTFAGAYWVTGLVSSASPGAGCAQRCAAPSRSRPEQATNGTRRFLKAHVGYATNYASRINEGIEKISVFNPCASAEYNAMSLTQRSLLADPHEPIHCRTYLHPTMLGSSCKRLGENSSREEPSINRPSAH